FEELKIEDVPVVGGKNASLGEITQSLASEGIPVPPGFAITAQVYWDFISNNNLQGPIAEQLAVLAGGKQTLSKTGAAIRALIEGGEFSDEQTAAISEAYKMLGDRVGMRECDVAVRSSATAEDLPEA